MASWGNEAHTQYEQDMDSNGNKLKVTQNHATNPAIEASNSLAGRAIKATGGILIPSGASNSLQVIDGANVYNVVGYVLSQVQIADSNHETHVLGDLTGRGWLLVYENCKVNGALEANTIQARNGDTVTVSDKLTVSDDVAINDKTVITHNHATEDTLQIINSTGRALKVTGKTDHTDGYLRLNGESLIMNDAAPTSATGLKYNSTESRIDFYVGGTVAGYLDSDGFHDA